MEPLVVNEVYYPLDFLRFVNGDTDCHGCFTSRGAGREVLFRSPLLLKSLLPVSALPLQGWKFLRQHLCQLGYPHCSLLFRNCNDEFVTIAELEDGAVGCIDSFADLVGD